MGKVQRVDRSAFLIPALVVAVAVGVTTTERLTAPDAPDRKVHVAYWEKWTGFEFDAMKRVVDAFNASQDRIQVDVLSVSAIQDKTLMAISGGVPPDVAGLYGSNVAQYADSRAVIELDDLAREFGVRKEDYIPVYWEPGVIGGKLYSLPSTPASTALHWNRDMYKAAGLNPDKGPETTEELTEWADRLTTRDASGKIKVSGFLPTEPGWWNWSFAPFFGGRLWDGKGRITINERESVRGYAWAQAFSKKYGAGQLQTFRSGFGNFSSPQNGFMAKELAMVPQGVWMYNYIKMYNPKLEWSAAPFPHPADRPDLADPSIVEEDILTIPRGAKHPREAFAFIAFVQSQKGMEMLCMGQKKLSPLKKVSPEFIDRHPNPYIKLFTRLAYSKNATTTPKIGIWPEYKSEIDATFDEIMLMQKTPKKALDDLTARMQPKLDTYLRRLRLREQG